MLESTCKSIHAALKEDREERGRELTEMKTETKEWRGKMEGKLGKMYWFIVTTLMTSVAALLMKIMDKVGK
jgi:hypothetical protein